MQDLLEKGPEGVEELHSSMIALGRLTQLQLIAGASADATVLDQLNDKFEVPASSAPLQQAARAPCHC